jgi:ferredoxin/flavodoxin
LKVEEICVDFDNVVLYTFSGTGNTDLIAKRLKENFEKQNLICQIQKIGKNKLSFPNHHNTTLIGIGYPIHAFNAPQPIVEAIKDFPETRNNQKVFIFKISGEPLKINNASSKTIFKILRNKGYTIVQEFHFLMPYNIWFRYSEKLANHMNRYTIAQSKLIVKQLCNGLENEIFNTPLRATIFAIIFRFQWPAAKLNGKLYTANRKKCNLCGVCERGCPVGNIEIINDRVHFSNRCAMCMYCSMYCPKDAINIGLLRPMKVNGPYNYNKLAKNESLNFPFISNNTKGIRSLFKKHYQNLDMLFKEYKIEL